MVICRAVIFYDIAVTRVVGTKSLSIKIIKFIVSYVYGHSGITRGI